MTLYSRWDLAVKAAFAEASIPGNNQRLKVTQDRNRHPLDRRRWWVVTLADLTWCWNCEGRKYWTCEGPHTCEGHPCPTCQGKGLVKRNG